MTTQATTTSTEQPVTPATEAPAIPAAVPAIDVDEQELLDAKAAAKAEETTAPASGDPAPQPPPQEPKAPPAAAPAAAEPSIPKPRFDEVLADRNKLAHDAAYWRGVAEGRQQTPPASGGQQPPAPAQPPTIEQRRAEIGTKIDALAKKFDDGEITMTDFRKQERELTAQDEALREEALLGRIKPVAPAPNNGNALYLETLTQQLEEKHPWVGVADEVGTKADWQWVKEQAAQRCVDRGVDPTKDDFGRYELRKEAAQLWDEVGPWLLTSRAQGKGIAIPGQQQQQAAPASGGEPQQQAKPPLSRGAQQRLDKLGLAASAPPNLSAMAGSVGDGSGQPTDAAIEAMSEDAIGNLPAATRNKLRGIAAG